MVAIHSVKQSTMPPLPPHVLAAHAKLFLGDDQCSCLRRSPELELRVFHRTTHSAIIAVSYRIISVPCFNTMRLGSTTNFLFSPSVYSCPYSDASSSWLYAVCFFCIFCRHTCKCRATDFARIGLVANANPYPHYNVLL